jgi:hypothetical protein
MMTRVAMVSGYMAQEPQDPMTYVPGGQDYKLYSWGADYTDGFGKPSNWGMSGGDQVFWPVK